MVLLLEKNKKYYLLASILFLCLACRCRCRVVVVVVVFVLFRLAAGAGGGIRAPVRHEAAAPPEQQPTPLLLLLPKGPSNRSISTLVLLLLLVVLVYLNLFCFPGAWCCSAYLPGSSTSTVSRTTGPFQHPRSLLLWLKASTNSVPICWKKTEIRAALAFSVVLTAPTTGLLLPIVAASWALVPTTPIVPYKTTFSVLLVFDSGTRNDSLRICARACVSVRRMSNINILAYTRNNVKYG